MISTPYEFAEVVLKQRFWKPMEDVIDLCLTLPETGHLTAEQIFLGACIFLHERCFQQLLPQELMERFEDVIIPGLQLKAVVKAAFESLSQEDA